MKLRFWPSLFGPIAVLILHPNFVVIQVHKLSFLLLVSLKISWSIEISVFLTCPFSSKDPRLVELFESFQQVFTRKKPAYFSLLPLQISFVFILNSSCSPTSIMRRYGSHNTPLTTSILSSKRALIDGDIDPLIAALIVESMHHSVEANRRHNSVPQNPIHRNRIMTVNKINEGFLDSIWSFVLCPTF